MKMAGSDPGHLHFLSRIVPATGASVLYSVLVGIEFEDVGAFPDR